MQQRMYARRFMRGLLSLGLLVGAAVMAGPAQAQTTSAGPYYAMPSWDQTLTATRFIILSNFLGAAVLDRETGLVWEKSPQTTPADWFNARFICTAKTVGNRKGWRLPSVHELASVIDPTRSVLALPFGHPFTLLSAEYWSATSNAGDPRDAWAVNVNSGGVGIALKTNSPITIHVWCVRGGMNAEAY